jgi:hypothetical protein
MTDNQPSVVLAEGETAAEPDAPLVPGAEPDLPEQDEADDLHEVLEAAEAEIDADAQAQAARIEAGEAPDEDGQARQRYSTGLRLRLHGTVNAPSHGGNRGRPTFGVFHSMECPMRAGYAASIAKYFARGPGTSCHYNVDPAETWGVLSDSLVGWHVGNANNRSIGLEQAGRAAMSRGEWTTPEGMAQHARAAEIVRHARDEYGIGMYFMSDQQLRDAHAGRIIGGWTTHDQCRRVIGGTSHTDPGRGWPGDVVMGLAAGQVPAAQPPAVANPSGVPHPPVVPWVLPAGHWLGNVAGPGNQHGGVPYDSPEVVAMVRCAQQHLVWRWCVPGIGNNWQALGWDDGKWEGATDDAMVTWHRKEYPGQPAPAQCWRDDWNLLTR